MTDPVINAELAALRDLCAVLNRDGGHRQDEVGTVQAAQEAERRYYNLLAEAAKLKEELRADHLEAAELLHDAQARQEAAELEASRLRIELAEARQKYMKWRLG